MMTENISKTMDIAKGIGIILMVIGHTSYLGYDFIYLFHMPLFFIISGFFFKPDNLLHKKSFVVKRMKRLYFPFVVWNILFLFLHNKLYDAGINVEYYYWKDYLYRLIKIFCFAGFEPFSRPLWFLKSLFIGSCVMLFVLLVTQKLPYKAWIRALVFFVLLVTGYILKIRYGAFPYDGHRELMMPCLIYMGYMIHRRHLLDRPPRLSVAWICLAILWICSRNFTFILAGAEIVNPILFLVISFIGFYMVYAFSYWLQKWKYLARILMFIGKRTMPILILHLLVFKLLHWGLFAMGWQGREGLDQAYNGDATYWLPYSLVGVALPLALYQIYKKVGMLFSRLFAGVKDGVK